LRRVQVVQAVQIVQAVGQPGDRFEQLAFDKLRPWHVEGNGLNFLNVARFAPS